MKKAIVFCLAALCAAIVMSACASTPQRELARFNFGEFVPLTGNVMQETEFNADNINVERQENRLIMRAGSVRIDYNLATGLANFYWLEREAPILTGVFAETEILGDRISSAGLSRPDGSVFLEEINDGFGPGVKVSVKNHGENISIWQRFFLYQRKDYILLEAIVESPTGTMTNYIAPIAAGTGSNDEVLSIEPADDPRFLFVPWCNDRFIRFRSDRLIGATESYGVTAIFDNTSRQGFVTGAVTHCTWKTGIRIRSGIGRGGTSPVVDFRVFGGITSPGVTHDTEPHGSIIGHHIHSPKIFLGFFDDWRDGMEEFGRACAIIQPPLRWDHGPPFGWNAWAAVADRIDHEVFMNASDFIRNEAPYFTNHNGIVFINFDSFWENWNMTHEELMTAAAHARANGHRPGIYGGFYSFWDPYNPDRPMTGTGGRWTYRQALLRDRRGRPLPPVSGALSLDPTHPGTIMRAATQIAEFIEWGFEYVKLDFHSHGAREGVFFNRNIRTGVQAYNYGMQRFIDAISEQIENQTFFISMSIGPMFPHQFTHARRISCDSFGTIDSAEYMLNSLTYGWWQGGTIYAFNDPDHFVLYNSYNHPDPILFNEGLTSFISRAITGMMLNSDDFRQPGARERGRQILNNQEINRMAADGISFRPVEGNTGDRSADLFVRHVREEGITYFAVFNFSRDRDRTITVCFERLGIDPSRTWQVRNMIAQQDEPPIAAGSMTIHLDAAEPGLFKLF